MISAINPTQQSTFKQRTQAIKNTKSNVSFAGTYQKIANISKNAIGVGVIALCGGALDAILSHNTTLRDLCLIIGGGVTTVLGATVALLTVQRD